MGVKRITANLLSSDVERDAAFFQQLFALDLAMDLDWVKTVQSDATSKPQLNLVAQNQDEAPHPLISIEVQDVDAVYEAAKHLNADICYALTDEPWGVRRFFVKDPSGNVINVLSHT